MSPAVHFLKFADSERGQAIGSIIPGLSKFLLKDISETNEKILRYLIGSLLEYEAADEHSEMF